MALDFLHNHEEFSELIKIVAEEQSINPVLVEKDYWIMHCLYGLQKLEFKFELKGGTSLSKGLGIIDRFSEDIDIRIEPPEDQQVYAGKNHTKPKHIASRKTFYEWLTKSINIDGIVNVERDTEFDNDKLTSAGIRLNYDAEAGSLDDLKEGVLLEVGFDTVSPNAPHLISSWAYDFGSKKVKVIDNRAVDVACYHPGYTFVEKLQTISTKFRKQQEEGNFPKNFMRHYYDVYKLLGVKDVTDFIGTDAYKKHKADRFRKADNQNLSENEAFLLSDAKVRKLYTDAYGETASLYYREKPDFEEILDKLTQAVKIEGI